jgi:hypothetical protein
VQHAEESGQRGYVLDSPTVKRHERVSYPSLRKMNRYPLEHWAELVLGYLAHVPHQEIRMQDSIARVSLIKERPVSRNMEVTDS